MCDAGIEGSWPAIDVRLVERFGAPGECAFKSVPIEVLCGRLRRFAMLLGHAQSIEARASELRPTVAIWLSFLVGEVAWMCELVNPTGC